MEKKKGTFHIRFAKSGNPYVIISREDARAMFDISSEWEIRSDLVADPPVTVVPKGWSTEKAQRSLETSMTTSIRVSTSDWKWFVAYCKTNGTSTCREIRKFIHVTRQDADFPPTHR